ncbi:hypothetical protein BD408DRAFT_407735 [Parasitella parasitica]|nr:hypothetical protein BD408DRAFT_407735 [Parasitella parasitica]
MRQIIIVFLLHIQNLLNVSNTKTSSVHTVFLHKITFFHLLTLLYWILAGYIVPR